jgi:hypothetical protein
MSRDGAKIVVIASALAVSIAAVIYVAVGGSSHRSEGQAVEATVNLSEQDSIPTASLTCGEGGTVVNEVVAIQGSDIPVRLSPSGSAPKLKNEKASSILGKEMFHSVDHSTTVRRLCEQGEWSEIKIETPDWLTHVQGWVPTAVFRQIEHRADGTRVYTEDDFTWGDAISAYKPQIVEMINKIARENKNCIPIHPSSVAPLTESKTEDPLLYVACGAGAGMFNVYFRPSDADSGKAFTARTPIDKTSAIRLCETEAKQAASHPSTVRFSRVLDVAFSTHPSGRARLVSSFTAKNSFNLELKHRIDCLFDGRRLIEANIAEL